MDAPWEILAFPHWSLYDKFRLGMLTLDVDVRGGVPKFDTYERLEDFEDVSALAFAKERTTENVYRTFFEPLLDAKFGERKEDVSAAWLLGRIKFRGERDIPERGNTGLPRRRLLAPSWTPLSKTSGVRTSPQARACRASTSAAAPSSR